MKSSGWIASVLGLAACGGPPAWDQDRDGCPDALADVATLGGESCRDMELYRWTEDRNFLLSVRVPLDSETYAPGASWSFDLPEAGIVRAEYGDRLASLSNEVCTDAMSDEEPAIEAAWDAASGTVRVDVESTRPEDEFGDIVARGTLSFTGVVLEGDGRRTCPVPDVTVEESWGWLPG